MRRALAIVGEWDTTWRQTRAVVGSDSTQCRWRHTVSKHQARIQQYLGLRPFDLDESNLGMAREFIPWERTGAP